MALIKLFLKEIVHFPFQTIGFIEKGGIYFN
jgi:hypothetical protein